MKQPIQACLLTFAVAVFFPAHAEQTVGLFLNTDEAFDGYTLFAPVTFQTTYLIDNEGRLVHSWVTAGQQTLGTYLLDNGNLLRTAAGFVQEYSWNGTLLWEYTSETPGAPIHHDNEPLPNGNVLIITSDSRSAAEAIAAGMDPARVGNGVVVDRVIEVQPVGASGNVVWEWWVWDHLVQDFNPLQENFGVVADNPGLIDINGSFPTGELIRMNAIDYNEELDQILLSARNYGEIWIIDHSTTTEEAAGHSGGASGKGGDLLYRWGNPQVYDRGGPEDQQLFYQHDSRWIDPGLPGAGNITAFNNGAMPSRVDEIVPPVDANGDYALDPGAAYGPPAPTWSYSGGFQSGLISGAHRLPNGNTLICSGLQGLFLEVTADQSPVWLYVNPVAPGGPVEQGDPADHNVFRAHRYPVDYPAFDGKDLTPGEPIELFDPPIPVADGSGATQPLTCHKGFLPDAMVLRWDTCAAHGFNLIFGNLAEVSSYTLQGAECSISSLGSFNWTDVPAGNLFFLIVGVDQSDCYESSWGRNSSGDERNGATPSNLCGATLKDTSEVCR